jgi:hypothetical protein
VWNRVFAQTTDAGWMARQRLGRARSGGAQRGLQPGRRTLPLEAVQTEATVAAARDSLRAQRYLP